ncbi:hypothetical protein GN956_G19275 [Arapaima gigas]
MHEQLTVTRPCAVQQASAGGHTLKFRVGHVSGTPIQKPQLGTDTGILPGSVRNLFSGQNESVSFPRTRHFCVWASAINTCVRQPHGAARPCGVRTRINDFHEAELSLEAHADQATHF